MKQHGLTEWEQKSKIMSYAAAAAKGPKQSPEEVGRSVPYRWSDDVVSTRRDAGGSKHTSGGLGVSAAKLPRKLPKPSPKLEPAIIKQTTVKMARYRYDANRPPQARAPAPPQVAQSESTSTSSLVDVDSPQVHTVPSDFREQDVQTDTQRDRIEHDAAAVEAQAIAAEQKAKKEFHEKELKAKEKAKKAANRVEKNTDNPVYIANAVTVVALGGALGLGAYRKYVAGELTWKVVGVWAGVVGLFAAGEVYLSKYVFSLLWH